MMEDDEDEEAAIVDVNRSIQIKKEERLITVYILKKKTQRLDFDFTLI